MSIKATDTNQIPEWIKSESVRDCANVEEFAYKYRKADRFLQRGESYVMAVLESHHQDIKTKGYTLISKYDNVTGELIAYYPVIN